MWHQNPKITKYNVYQLLPPFIIHNCLPKATELQFISKAITKHTKTILGQITHEVCASEDISKLEFRMLIEGYSWSKLFRFNPLRDGE